MKSIILLSLFLFGCTYTHKYEELQHRTVTDSRGCKYIVNLGIGETLFLENIVEDNPHCKDAFK